MIVTHCASNGAYYKQTNSARMREVISRDGIVGYLPVADRQVTLKVDRTGVAPVREASKGLLVTAPRPCPAARPGA
jgi:hypothetical protein